MTMFLQVTEKTIGQIAREVIGATYHEADQIIKDAGFLSWPVMVDGAGIRGYGERTERRLKLVIVNDVVTDAQVG